MTPVAIISSPFVPCVEMIPTMITVMLSLYRPFFLVRDMIPVKTQPSAVEDTTCRYVQPFLGCEINDERQLLWHAMSQEPPPPAPSARPLKRTHRRQTRMVGVAPRTERITGTCYGNVLRERITGIYYGITENIHTPGAAKSGCVVCFFTASSKEGG